MCANDMEQKVAISSALQQYALSDALKRFKMENEPEFRVKQAMCLDPEHAQKLRNFLSFSDHMHALHMVLADGEDQDSTDGKDQGNTGLPPERSNSAASSAATTAPPRKSNARGSRQRNASTTPTNKMPVRGFVAPKTPKEDAPATPKVLGTSAPATPTWNEEDSDDSWGSWGKGSKRMPDAGSTGDEPPPKCIETDYYTRFPHGRPPGMPAFDMPSADVEAFARDKAKRPKATRKTAEAKREENRRKVEARKTTWKWNGERASRWGESPWKWDGKPGESHWAAQGRRRVVAPRKWPVAGSNTSLTLAKPDDHHPCRVVPGCIMIHSVATCSHCLAVSRSTLLLHVYVA